MKMQEHLSKTYEEFTGGNRRTLNLSAGPFRVRDPSKRHLPTLAQWKRALPWSCRGVSRSAGFQVCTPALSSVISSDRGWGAYRYYTH